MYTWQLKACKDRSGNGLMNSRKPLIVLILTLVLVSAPLLVAAAPCAMADASPELAMGDMEASAHAGHKMADTQSGSAADSDCCDDGYCSICGCAALVLMADNVIQVDSPQADLFLLSLIHTSPNPLPRALYRPPTVI